MKQLLPASWCAGKNIRLLLAAAAARSDRFWLACETRRRHSIDWQRRQARPWQRFAVQCWPQEASNKPERDGHMKQISFAVLEKVWALYSLVQ
jgi:hypothetical protein